MKAAPPARGMVRIALVVYLPMLASAAFLQPPGLLRVSDPVLLAAGLATAALGGLTTVAASRWVSRGTDWGRRLHAEFHTLLGGLDSPQILLLSLLSAGGEEVLFRGVLQPRLGLWLATLLFAGLHFPLRRALVPWTGFAFGLGLALGALTLWSASLWPAILLHFLVNYFNLHDLAAPLAPPPGTPAAP